jgi:hypothetical protein
MQEGVSMNAKVETELFFVTPTRVGLLAEVTEVLRDAGVDIRAIGAYDKDDHGEFMLVVSDTPLAKMALGRIGIKAVEKSVVTVEVPDRPGALAEVARKVADVGVNVGWVYATTSDSPTAMLVLRTEDNNRVADLLS